MTAERDHQRRAVLAAAGRRLAEAGVPEPGVRRRRAARARARAPPGPSCSRSRRWPPDRVVELEDLVARRSRREPLQHLTGVAHFRHVTLAVGPGVFVPRPETELLAGWAIEQARAADGTVVLDLGHGLGRHRRGRGRRGPDRAGPCPGARRAGPRVGRSATWPARASSCARATWPRRFERPGRRRGRDGDQPAVHPARRRGSRWRRRPATTTPTLALWSGGDGLDTIRALDDRAAILLRPGRRDRRRALPTSRARPLLRSSPTSGRWTEVKDHRDLADRPRFLTARLAR